MPSLAPPATPAIPIERRQRLSPAPFEQEYLSGAGRPVIVTDALDAWQARGKWTFEFFRDRYGQDPVGPVPELSSPSLKVMKLAEYLDYIDAPSANPPGFWLDRSRGVPLPQPLEPPTTPLYLVGWNAFFEHPELLDDIVPSPYFVDDWMALLSPDLCRLLQATSYRPSWILIGPPGSVSRLHHDFLHTHAYLAQIAGRKKCILFSPEDAGFLYDGAVDPERPDWDRFPLFARARAWECVLEPGEMLFLPAGWRHAVVGLSKTITVSYNFFNRVNFGAYFDGLLRALPAIVSQWDRLPDARKALGIAWVCRGFDHPEGAAPPLGYR